MARQGKAAQRIIWRSLTVTVSIVLAFQAWPASVTAQGLSLRIPPVRTTLKIANQPVTIVTRGMISSVSPAHGQNIFEIRLIADLSGLQENVTGLLRSELDRSEQCGDRIAIEHATLAPGDPACILTTQLHYERWACVKIFGKRAASKLVGGDGMIKLRLTPVLETQDTLRLAPQVLAIQAQGPLGDLLRSGSVGAMLRRQLSKSIVSAMQKGTKLSVTVPPAAEPFVAIQNVRFRDAGFGHLALVLTGAVRISPQQLQLLASQLNERLSSR
jgi:hypothetical protein